MKTLTKTLGIALVIAGFALALPAYATMVSYTVDGWSQQFPAPTTPPANAPWGPNGYPGDTVTLTGGSGTLDLVPGSYIKQIDTLKWNVDYTYGGTATDPLAWSDILFAFNAARNMQIGTETATLSQPGTLTCTWFYDLLSVYGDTATFNLQGYRVDVTPIAVVDWKNDWGLKTVAMNARFDVTRLTAAARSVCWAWRFSDWVLCGESLAHKPSSRTSYSRMGRRNPALLISAICSTGPLHSRQLNPSMAARLRPSDQIQKELPEES